MSSLDWFELVAQGRLTPEDAADLVVYERRLREPWWMPWARLLVEIWS